MRTLLRMLMGAGLLGCGVGCLLASFALTGWIGGPVVETFDQSRTRNAPLLHLVIDFGAIVLMWISMFVIAGGLGQIAISLGILKADDKPASHPSESDNG